MESPFVTRIVLVLSLLAGLGWGSPLAAQTLPYDSDEGTFSSVRPRVPEPMVFDLVRPLGAHRGELEVNSLFRFTPDGAPARLAWAPEVEYTFADGYGIEFELPMENGSVHAYKAAVQGTLPGPIPRRFIHGWQAIAERARHGGRPQLDLLYLAGSRWHPRWSAFTMTGVRREQEDDRGTFLGNYTLFFHASPDVTVGLESNLASTAASGRHVLVMPQLHLRKNRVNVQIGTGLVHTPGAGSQLQIGWRLSREF